MNDQRSDSSSLPNPTCSKVLDDLGAFLDGELAPEACMSLEEHLAVCSSCRRRQAELRDDWSLLEGMTTPVPSDPDALLAGVRRRIRRDRRRRFFGIAMSAAAAAAVLFLMWPGVSVLEVDKEIIEHLSAVEDLHGEIDAQMLNLLALNPDLFLPPLSDDDLEGYDDGETEISLDEIIDFLLDESEGQKL